MVLMVVGMVILGCNGAFSTAASETSNSTIAPGNPADLPQLTSTLLRVEPPEPKSQGERPFAVNVDFALLFDPRTGPINAQRSDESGVHLLVAGRIRNQTGKLIHRAAVYTTLIASFSKRTELERHSGGLGFSPRVTSLDPWRPDTDRIFICQTRPFDPIYLELPPEKVQAAITIQVRDPLQYSYRGEIKALNLDWASIFGLSLNGAAMIATDGQGYCAPSLKTCELSSGDTVKVLYQRGTAFKVMNDDGDIFWLGYEQLSRISLQPPVAAADSGSLTFPIAVLLNNGLNLKILRVSEQDHRENAKETRPMYRLDIQLENKGQKSIRTPPANAFILDGSAGAYASPLFGRSAPREGYRSITLRSGQQMEGSLFYPREEGTFPFDLEVHLASSAPVRIPLFPALRAGPKTAKRP